MPDENLKQRLTQIDDAGRKRFGEDEWTQNINRLRQQTGGLPEQVVAATAADPNATSHFYRAGQDARLQLLQRAQDSRDGDPTLAAELEAEHTHQRALEREQWRVLKGRR
jgi:hypothetical protein